MQQQQKIVVKNPAVSELTARVSAVKFNDDQPINTQARTQINSGKMVALPASVDQFVDVSVLTNLQEIDINDNSPSQRDVVVKVATTQGGLLDKQCMRAALDLVCVIDISGSMIGFNPDGSRSADGKIDKVKRTLIRLLDLLTEADRVSLITFNSKAKRLTPLLPLNAGNKTQLVSILNAITPGGSTNIFEGLSLALSVLHSRREQNQVSSVFLLSDGCDKLSQDLLNKTFSNPKSFECFPNVSINTFGFGDDECSLMEMVADRSGGMYYDIEDYGSECLECFVECLGTLLSIIGGRATLKISILPSVVYPEVAVCKVLSENVEKLSEIELEVDLKFLISGMARNTVFSINLPPVKESLRKEWVGKEAQVVSATLSFQNLTNSEIMTLPSKHLALKLSGEPSKVQNEEVVNQILRAELFNFQKNQISLIEKGQLEEAKLQDQIFNKKHAEVLALKKNDKVMGMCYAQYANTQQYVQNYSATPQTANYSQKRKLVSGAYSMKCEQSNRQNKGYRNAMQRNLFEDCELECD